MDDAEREGELERDGKRGWEHGGGEREKRRKGKERGKGSEREAGE